MANVTIEELLDQARDLTAEERRRLAELLMGEPAAPVEPGRASGATFLDTDPWFVELREAQRRAEDETGLHTLDQIMSRTRKQCWTADPG